MNRTQMITLLTGTALLLTGVTLAFSPPKVVTGFPLTHPHSALTPSLTAENSGGIIILPHALPERTAEQSPFQV